MSNGFMKNDFFWDVTPCEPHGATSQKTPFFIVTAVKTSKISNGFTFVLRLLHN
jgi:hypothetical protein